MLRLARAEIPLLVLLSEHDPELIQRHGLSLLNAVLQAQKKLPRFAQLAGHNHFSILLHLNSPETSLGDQLKAFIRRS